MTTQDIKPGYKQSTIGPIPNNWIITNLGQICDIYQPKTISGSEINESGKYRVYGANGIIGYYEQYNHENSEVTMTCRGATCGTINYTKPKSWITGNAMVITPKSDDIIKPYLKYRLSLVKLNTIITGAAQPQITRNNLEYLSIPLPPLPEQEAIANILGKVDETIEKTQNMIDKLELRNKGLEQKLLKNDNRKEIKLGNLFGRVTDKNSEGNTNVVTISAQKGFIKQNDFFNKFVASETLDNYYLVKKGEFCYNKSYSNGYPMGAIKRLNDFDKAVVTTLYICFKIKDLNKTSGDFFEYYFDAGLLDKGLTQIAYEGGRAHGLLNVSPNDFFNLKIRVPEFEEQKAIANILNKANEQLNLYKQKLEKLQELKKGLMQQLLTGKVRVKEFRN